MKVCIYGVGAIGGMLAVKLAHSGQDVWVTDQGARLDQIRANGLQLKMANGSEFSLESPNILVDAAPIDGFDLIAIGVKAHQIESVAPLLPKLYRPQTTVMTIQNGIPWWYFQRYQGNLADTRLESCDPKGIISRFIPVERILGCVVYPAVDVGGTGIIQHKEGNRFTLGELDGSITTRAQNVVAMLNAAGFKAYTTEDIRAELWLKALGTLSFNPISALTGCTMSEIAKNPATRSLVGAMMAEAQEIAHKLGITFRHTIERRIKGAEAVGAHKTSMLQDFEAGRSMEVDALIGSIVELGELTQTPCDSIKAIWACVTLLNLNLPD